MKDIQTESIKSNLHLKMISFNIKPMMGLERISQASTSIVHASNRYNLFVDS